MSASRAADPEFDSPLCCGDLFRLSHTSDLKTGTPVATCQAPVLTLVGVVSVCCVYVRQKV